VVVGADANGLGVVRSLAKQRITTIVVDTSAPHAAMWSRWARPFTVSRLYGRPLIDGLLKLQSLIGARAVLILTDEKAVNTVSQYRRELEQRYRFHLPPAEMVTTLASKARFHEFAVRHELPVPRTITLGRDSEITHLAELQFPVVVKPVDKGAVHLAQAERASRVGTMEEAEVVCRRMLAAAGQLVAQDWVEGADSDIYFALFHCERDASPSVFFGRKIACHPPRVGSTAVCVAAPEAAEPLGPLVADFVAASAYEGLGSLEFKRDSRDERFMIIEPTVGRTDWQEEIATLNGVNLPLIAYCRELGLPPPPHLSAGRAAAWCESLRHRKFCSRLDRSVRVHDGYWRIDDPVPAFAFYAGSALRAARRLVTRLARLVCGATASGAVSASHISAGAQRRRTGDWMSHIHSIRVSAAAIWSFSSRRPFLSRSRNSSVVGSSSESMR